MFIMVCLGAIHADLTAHLCVCACLSVDRILTRNVAVGVVKLVKGALRPSIDHRYLSHDGDPTTISRDRFTASSRVAETKGQRYVVSLPCFPRLCPTLRCFAARRRLRWLTCSFRAENNKDTLCRNVLIYGHCRYEDQGCTFNHDQNKNNSQPDL